MGLDLNAQLAAAKAEADAAESKLTEDDRAEQTVRDSIAKERDRKLAAESARRDLDLARREDAAREALPVTKLAPLAIDGGTDTYVIMHDPQAFRVWEHGQEMAAKKKANRADVSRAYAVASVYDWNGLTDFDVNPESTNKLTKHLRDNPAQVTPIVNAAGRLAGIFAEERKSGG